MPNHVSPVKNFNEQSLIIIVKCLFKFKVILIYGLKMFLGKSDEIVHCVFTLKNESDQELLIFPRNFSRGTTEEEHTLDMVTSLFFIIRVK